MIDDDYKSILKPNANVLGTEILQDLKGRSECEDKNQLPVTSTKGQNICARVCASPRIWTIQAQMSEPRGEFDDEPVHCIFPESLHHCEGSPPIWGGRDGWSREGWHAPQPSLNSRLTKDQASFAVHAKY